MDYVIITSEKLKKSFEPLRNFKTVLGVRTKLLIKKDIGKKYREGDLQSKIKRQIIKIKSLLFYYFAIQQINTIFTIYNLVLALKADLY